MDENRSSRVRAKYEQVLLPVGRLLAKTGVTANALSVLSLITAGVCTYFFWIHQLIYGIVFLILASIIDMLDGSVARATGQLTRFGAVLDHTLDRYVEFLFLLGFGLGGYVPFPLIYFAFFSMIMASFVRAKAESVGGLESCAGIGIERKEKLTLLALGAILTFWHKDALTIAVLFITILSQLAVLLRLRYTYQHADH